MTPTSSHSPRRRLSRRMPWHVPAALLFLACSLLFALTLPLRARERPVATPPDGPASRVAQGVPPTALVSEGSVLPGGDPLNDPTVRPSTLESDERINILILGTDGRDEEDGPPRTDLMMLLLLDRPSQRATLVSLPRDLWVAIPGYGEGKINTAYFLGSLEERGPALARETVEELVGQPIDHTVEIDFHGFRTLIDEMGGIQLEVPERIDDPEYPDGNYGTLHLQIPAGEQRMDGEMALRYARTRHGGTDMERSARQQAVILAIREQALAPAQLARAPLLLRTLYRVVESDLALGDLFALARFARTLDRERIAMHTLNGDLVWPVLTWNGQDALLCDPAEVRARILAWSRGETLSATD